MIKNLIKKSVLLTAGVTTILSTCAINASAYTKQKAWNASYVLNGGASVNHLDKQSVRVNGYGYKTYCSNIGGSNDRYIQVKPQGGAKFRITSKGYSSVFYVNVGNSREFNIEFGAHGKTNCSAGGTVGWNC